MIHSHHTTDATLAAKFRELQEVSAEFNARGRTGDLTDVESDVFGDRCRALTAEILGTPPQSLHGLLTKAETGIAISPCELEGEAPEPAEKALMRIRDDLSRMIAQGCEVSATALMSSASPAGDPEIDAMLAEIRRLEAIGNTPGGLDDEAWDQISDTQLTPLYERLIATPAATADGALRKFLAFDQFMNIRQEAEVHEDGGAKEWLFLVSILEDVERLTGLAGDVPAETRAEAKGPQAGNTDDPAVLLFMERNATFAKTFEDPDHGDQEVDVVLEYENRLGAVRATSPEGVGVKLWALWNEVRQHSPQFVEWAETALHDHCAMHGLRILGVVEGAEGGFAMEGSYKGEFMAVDLNDPAEAAPASVRHVAA